MSQPGGVQPRLIVPAQHLTLLTSNGTTTTPQTYIEPKKEGPNYFLPEFTIHGLNQGFKWYKSSSVPDE